MTPKKARINPFYVLLVLVGVAFVVTACAYTLLIVTETRSGELPAEGEPGAGLLQLMSDHGLAILASEIAVLTVATIAAIGLDQHRAKRKQSL